MFDYQAMQATATRLIAVQFGGSFTGAVITRATKTYNPVLVEDEFTYTDNPVSALRISIINGLAAGIAVNEDQVVFALTADFEPINGDAITVDGVQYSVSSVEVKKPANVVLVYFAICDK